MAKKVNLMKLAYVNRGQAEVTNRRHAPETALYLIQLQLPKTKLPPSKRKLTVIMDADPHDAVPRPVKIIHLV